MSEAFDGEKIARERIAQEAERRTGFLDLGGLGLTTLPEELFGLRHLRELNLGSGWRLKDGSWQEVYSPSDSSVPGNNVTATLARLSELPEFRTLSVADTPIADLTPLRCLTALQSLDCGGTQVADLTPLAGLLALQTLYCGGTRVADLTPLAGLLALETLDCRSTPVADLTPLAGLISVGSR